MCADREAHFALERYLTFRQCRKMNKIAQFRGAAEHVDPANKKRIAVAAEEFDHGERNRVGRQHESIKHKGHEGIKIRLSHVSSTD